MKRLESLERLGIKFGVKSKVGFYVTLQDKTPHMDMCSPQLLAWGHYTGFIVMNKEKQMLVNYNSKFGRNEKDLIPIIDSNIEQGTYILLEGKLTPYYLLLNISTYLSPVNINPIKACIKFSNRFYPITSFSEYSPYYNYRRTCDIEQANYIVIEHNRVEYFVLLTD